MNDSHSGHPRRSVVARALRAAPASGARARLRVPKWRAVVVLSAALLLLTIGAGSAAAQDDSSQPPPVFKGEAGQRIDGIGRPDASGNCRNARNVRIHFGDGTSGPPDAVNGTRISGHHTYRAGGIYLGTADADVTCTSNATADPDDQSPPVTRDYHVVGVPGGTPLGFIVVVGCAGNSTARTSQAAGCDFPPAVQAPDQAVTDPVKAAAQAQSDMVFRASIPQCGSFGPGLIRTLSSVVKYTTSVLPCMIATLQIIHYDRVVNDPPDPLNAARIVRPKRVVLPRVRAPGCATRQCRLIRRAAKRYIQRSTRVASLARALSASGDRFTGARELAPIAVNDIQVLQAAMSKVYAGKLAAAMRRQQASARRLARLLRRARVRLSITDEQARTTAQKLARLEGFSEAQLDALERNGVTRAQLRQLFSTGAPSARGTTLNRVLTRAESTRRLRSFYRSLTVAQIAHVENELFKTRVISVRRHARLARHLKRAHAARSRRSRRRAMRRFVRDAKRVRGTYGSLLRTAGRAKTR